MPTINPRQIWERVLTRLRSEHPQVCRHWFRAIQPIGEVDGSFRAIVETSVHKSYLQKQCAEYFNDALQQETGRLVPILFVDSDAESTQKTNGTANGHALSAICDDVVINPDYTFENFIEGPTTGSAPPPPKPSPPDPAPPITRSSCMAASAWAKLTFCRPSASTSSITNRTPACST